MKANSCQHMIRKIIINNNIVSVDIQCIHNSDKWHLTFLEVCDVWNVRTVVTILHDVLR